MIRFLIYLAVVLAIYFYLRKLFPGRKQYGRRGYSADSRKPPPVTDELVQDPVCGAYCPKREAKSLVYRGKKYYFCSMECLKEFQERNR
jgi:YHS domain-containing protein